jgi:hypothetical protein
MMHTARPVLLAVAVAATSASARADVAFFHELGVAVAAPTGAVFSASYAPTFSFLGGRLHAGLGPRLSAYLDEGSVAYPNGDPGLLAAGARNTLTVTSPRTIALDLMLAAAFRIFGGLEVGMNIDLVGVGFGPSVTGSYAGTDPALAGPQRARPTAVNLLLLGTHDRGQLDSEFFAAYWFGAWGVRAGVSHMSTEYTTSRVLDGGNDRFRASATRLFVAAGYRIPG